MPLLLLLWIPAIALAQRTPSISWIQREQVVDIGSSVELQCSVQYAQNYPILWVKRFPDNMQDLPISTGPTLIVRSSRYTLRHYQGSSTYSLQIKDIQESDGGEYMCQVILGINNRISASTNLIVRRPPVISDNSTRNVVVSEGNPLNLECYAGGMPQPIITWHRENNAILPTGGSIMATGNKLQILKIRKEDRGAYYCIADNGVGRGARRNVNVEVEFAPIVKATRPIVYQALQFDMDLECHVEAYPPAAIRWVFKEESLVNNQHYRLSQFATADDYTDTTLRLLSIEKRQFGNYSCVAMNKLGQSHAVVQLIDKTPTSSGKPQPSTAPPASTFLEKTSLALAWERMNEVLAGLEQQIAVARVMFEQLRQQSKEEEEAAFAG